MAANAIVSLSMKVNPGTWIVNRQPVFTCRLESLKALGMSLHGGVQKSGVPFWGPHNKDYSIWGVYIGVLYLGKLAAMQPHVLHTNGIALDHTNGMTLDTGFSL